MGKIINLVKDLYVVWKLSLPIAGNFGRNCYRSREIELMEDWKVEGYVWTGNYDSKFLIDPGEAISWKIP